MIASSQRRLEITRRVWTLLFAAALGLFAAGCLSRPALIHQTFALQNPPATNSAPAGGGGVLALRTVQVSPMFAERPLVYRTGPNSYEIDSYAGFLTDPGVALAIPIRGYLRNSGLFKDVTEPGSPVRANRVLDVFVTEFYGDFRKPGTPAAVLSLRMILSDAANPARPRIGLDKDYTRRVPLKTNTAADVVAAYDMALAEIMNDVVSALAGSGRRD